MLAFGKKQPAVVFGALVIAAAGMLRKEGPGSGVDCPGVSLHGAGAAPGQTVLSSSEHLYKVCSAPDTPHSC